MLDTDKNVTIDNLEVLDNNKQTLINSTVDNLELVDNDSNTDQELIMRV